MYITYLPLETRIEELSYSWST